MTLRPTFVWHVPTGCIADTFEIQVDNSCSPGQIAGCAFPSPEIATTVPFSTNHFTPTTALAVQTTAPVGAIYSWRVRACAGGSACGAWSEVGYVNVGRVPNDINGDGYADLIASSTDSSQYYLEIYPGGATPGTAASVHFGSCVSASFIGDINGDGFTDFICQQQLAVPMVNNPLVVFGGPSLAALNSTSLTSDQAQWNSITAFSDGGDFNGDGFSDLAVSFTSGQTTTQETFRVYFGAATFVDKAPDLTAAGPSTVPSSNPPCLVADLSRTVGDINGDGFSDLAIFHVTTTCHASLVRLFLGGSTPDVVGDADIALSDLVPLPDPSGDVDGDGYDDIVLNVGGYGVLRGAPTLPTSFTPISGSNGTAIISGFDLEGDGKTDYFVKSGDLDYRLFLGDSTAVILDALTPLRGKNSLTWADYNGDGRVDFATGDTTTHQVSLVLNDGTLNPAASAPLPAPASPYTLTGAIARGR